jgi:hypothetical protein
MYYIYIYIYDLNELLAAAYGFTDVSLCVNGSIITVAVSL